MYATGTTQSRRQSQLTDNPATETTSVYPSTTAVEPSPNLRWKLLPVSDALWLSDGSYTVWPEQVSLQSGPGKNRSLLPVSKSTGAHQLSDMRVKRRGAPRNLFAGAPTEIDPYHSCWSAGASGIEPMSRFSRMSGSMSRGCLSPVFLSYA